MRIFFGWVLILLGIVIALPTGLCTVAFFHGADAGLVFLLGILPCLVGIGIFLLGKRLAFPKE